MEEAEEDVLAYAAFPAEHWQKIWSNNPPGATQQGGQEEDERSEDLPN
jgi:hypothetical protein